MSRRKVPELDTPFSSVEWPVISQESQDTILELLCNLLSPLGQHRRHHVVPSQGKRSRRRIRQANKTSSQEDANSAPLALDRTMGAELEILSGTQRQSEHAPPPPELARFVDTGLVAVTRELAKYASLNITGITAQEAPVPPSIPAPTSVPSPPSSAAPYAAVFVVRSGHPSAFYSHFPQMVAVASQQLAAASPDSPTGPIRLVGFSHACEDRLGASLGIPRVSAVALRSNAPQCQGLLKLLEETVPTVDVRWLDEAQTGEYRDTQIHIADISVGPKRKKKM
ncbi:RNase P and RNase MRP subunit [Sporothrix epigloea]|uniref:RNase P and RNase MRP subunit n=1 Tax=Sporothrix epigloea TaxID=1892477 RepID=A0ABP0E5I4_9PEZI